MAVDAYFKAAAAQLRRAADTLAAEARELQTQVTHEEQAVQVKVNQLKQKETRHNVAIRNSQDSSERMLHERELAQTRLEITKTEQEFYARRDELAKSAQDRETRSRNLIQEAQGMESRTG